MAGIKIDPEMLDIYMELLNKLMAGSETDGGNARLEVSGVGKTEDGLVRYNEEVNKLGDDLRELYETIRVNVDEEEQWKVFDFVEDFFMEELEIGDYINDINSYHLHMFDKHDVTTKKFDAIVEKAGKVDANYAAQIEGYCSLLGEYGKKFEAVCAMLALDLIGVIPVIGALKYSDEIGTLFKNADKVSVVARSTDGAGVLAKHADEAGAWLHGVKVFRYSDETAEAVASGEKLLKESGTIYESFADMMSPEDAKRYLDFLENGSREGLTGAELAGVEKADALLVSRKVGYEDVWDLRNAGDVLESGSKGGLDTIIKNGKVSIDDIKTNPSTFSGKSAEEIADVLRNSGYDVTIKNSTRSRSGAQIIQINNSGGGKNISQVQVSPGGGRHGSNPYVKISTTDQGIIKIVDGIEGTYKTDGKETATIIFSGGN